MSFLHYRRPQTYNCDQNVTNFIIHLLLKYEFDASCLSPRFPFSLMIPTLGQLVLILRLKKWLDWG